MLTGQRTRAAGKVRRVNRGRTFERSSILSRYFARENGRELFCFVHEDWVELAGAGKREGPDKESALVHVVVAF